ncbi:MAG: phosphotransferase, partial [Deltaproteobacteria bacterium]|nr:phosphotransferase [Deltaproteobacteria bacterium]
MLKTRNSPSRRRMRLWRRRRRNGIKKRLTCWQTFKEEHRFALKKRNAFEARFGKPMESSDRKLFENATRKITAEIVKMPYTFTHRDFQSRNLIVRSDNSLAMIDFQDAL